MKETNGCKYYELDNGLVVAMQPMPINTISAKLRVNYGPVNEQKGEEGLAHFLEHCLCSGGSEKYSPQDTVNLRGYFGDSNACTSSYNTFFT